MLPSSGVRPIGLAPAGPLLAGMVLTRKIPRSGRWREDLGTTADEIRNLAGGVPAPRGNRDLRAAIRQRNGSTHAPSRRRREWMRASLRSAIRFVSGARNPSTSVFAPSQRPLRLTMRVDRTDRAWRSGSISSTDAQQRDLERRRDAQSAQRHRLRERDDVVCVAASSGRCAALRSSAANPALCMIGDRECPIGFPTTP